MTLEHPVPPQTGPCSVVISYFDGRPVEPLRSLVTSLLEHPAGMPFELTVVVNQQSSSRSDLALPDGVRIEHRENRGFNIGAWDHGWRLDPLREGYLFLQDECVLKSSPWLSPFVAAAAGPGVGLVGERLSPPWNATWAELERRFKGHTLPGHLIDGQPAERIPCYRHFLATNQIDAGPRGNHLQTLVLFARRAVLEAINGFPIGRNYGEAIAAEIGASKKVMALGLTLCQVAPEPFSVFLHPQWQERAGQHDRMGWRG